jgi:hypothetical protein
LGCLFLFLFLVAVGILYFDCRWDYWFGLSLGFSVWAAVGFLPGFLLVFATVVVA